MSFNHRILHSCLLSTALCSAMLFVLAPATADAFNPNEGQEPLARSTSQPRLPSVAPLLSPVPRLNFSNAAAAAPRVLPTVQAPDAEVKPAF